MSVDFYPDLTKAQKVDKAKEWLANGWTREAIGDEFGITYTTLLRWLNPKYEVNQRNNNIKWNKSPKGIAWRRAHRMMKYRLKLAENATPENLKLGLTHKERAANAAKMYAEGKTRLEIQNIFNVSKATVFRWISPEARAKHNEYNARKREEYHRNKVENADI